MWAAAAAADAAAAAAAAAAHMFLIFQLCNSVLGSYLFLLIVL